MSNNHEQTAYSYEEDGREVIVFPAGWEPMTFEETVAGWEQVLGKTFQEFSDREKKELLQTGRITTGEQDAA